MRICSEVDDEIVCSTCHQKKDIEEITLCDVCEEPFCDECGEDDVCDRCENSGVDDPFLYDYE